MAVSRDHSVLNCLFFEKTAFLCWRFRRQTNEQTNFTDHHCLKPLPDTIMSGHVLHRLKLLKVNISHFSQCRVAVVNESRRKEQVQQHVTFRDNAIPPGRNVRSCNTRILCQLLLLLLLRMNDIATL